MRINDVSRQFNLNHKRINTNQIKTLVPKTKKVINNVENSECFWAKPVKYSILGLAIPLPFAFIIGFFVGVGVALYNKLLNNNNKDNPS